MAAAPAHESPGSTCFNSESEAAGRRRHCSGPAGPSANLETGEVGAFEPRCNLVPLIPDHWNRQGKSWQPDRTAAIDDQSYQPVQASFQLVHPSGDYHFPLAVGRAAIQNELMPVCRDNKELAAIGTNSSHKYIFKKSSTPHTKALGWTVGVKQIELRPSAAVLRPLGAGCHRFRSISFI